MPHFQTRVLWSALKIPPKGNPLGSLHFCVCALSSNLDCYKNSLCHSPWCQKLPVEHKKWMQSQLANFPSSEDSIQHELHWNSWCVLYQQFSIWAKGIAWTTSTAATTTSQSKGGKTLLMESTALNISIFQKKGVECWPKSCQRISSTVHSKEQNCLVQRLWSS